ncbi:MAG: BlaI/MecI/CopY family transcriptional regulator [Planctomycetota bacterium]|jgi:hypothetical protein
MEAVRALGDASVRDVPDHLPEPRPAYTTVLTVMQKLAKAGWLDAPGRGPVRPPDRPGRAHDGGVARGPN